MSRTVRARGLLLWIRALLLASVALLAGTVAHVGAHGLLPGPVTMAVLLAAGTAGSAPLLLRPASTPRIVLLVALGQTAVHVALTAVAGHRGDPPPGYAPTRWVQHLSEDLTGAHALMALAHLAASAVVGLWLARGEQAFWALVSLTGRSLALVARPAPVPLVTGRPRVVPVDHAVLPPATHVRRPSLRRRGPPRPRSP